LIAPAKLSKPLIKETGPEATPPTDNGSMEERILERLIPEPEPPLNIMASVLARSMMELIESPTELMKQAEH
jgi:hypothetical protein